MRTLLTGLFAFAFGLLTTGADAGEEISPMQGPAGIVRTTVVVANNFPAEIRWRSALFRTPLLVAGGSLEMKVLEGYGTARPYVRLPEQGGGILARLMNALASE